MFNNLKVSSKIILPIIFILALGNIITNYITTSKMQEMSKNNAKESLSMLSDSIFITLRNAMNTGDPAIIKHAEDQSRDGIKGLTSLIVAKSKETIELYSPQTKFTTDKDILNSFATKKEQVIDFNEDGKHFIKVIKPMIATDECIMCHANQNVGDVIGVIDLKFSLDEADEAISSTIGSILSVSIAFILLTLLAVWFISKKVTKPLTNLQSDLGEFFAFLSHERDTIEPFEVHSMDEIGQMVVTLNENIAKTTKGIKQDADAIAASAAVCKDASNGNLNVKINTNANNPEINNLVSIVNDLLGSLNYNIDRTLGVLDHYTHDEYSSRINSKGTTTGEIKKLFDQVDILGDTLTKLSTQNLKNGKALQQTSMVFSQNLEKLSNSSSQQEISLKNTSNSLDEVTKNIENTTNNSATMSQLANEVTNSSNKGHDLAEQTASAMSEINTKIEAINEAIVVIDQISFQTNILSLNAAVEAATAGEAGKGFAVVAQEVRNLASRSAEAANEIKNIVSIATNQAKDGATIANDMIDGYKKLNQNISSTIELIQTVANDSKVQAQKIKEVNIEINDLNKITQENAQIANDTNIVAQQANDIAQKIVDDASKKDFSGKQNIHIRKKVIDPNYSGPERRKIEKNMKSNR